MSRLAVRVGQEIRRRREEREWSQTQLAFYSGMGASMISLIETGKRNPTVATLHRIALSLEVEIRDLFPSEQTKG